MGLRGKARVLKMKLDLVADTRSVSVEEMGRSDEFKCGSAEDGSRTRGGKRLRGHCRLGQKQYRKAIEEYSEAL